MALEPFWDSHPVVDPAVRIDPIIHPHIIVETPFATPPGGRHGICARNGVTRRKSMKFSFEVGEIEKHQVEFKFNQLYGTLLISVDQLPIRRATRLLNEPIQEVFDFTVGNTERWPVRIEKRRKPLFGSRNILYVNNRLMRVVDGF
jgi:hypothetical protein